MSLKHLHDALLADVQHGTQKADLAGVKRELMRHGLLVPGSGGKQQSSSDLRAAADILEASALLSVRKLQVAQFESFLSLLSAFEGLPPSPLRPKLIALHLLLLLSRNQIGAFHTQLERITASEPKVMDTPEVAFVVEMERCLMEGSYSKVWQIAQKRQKPPMPEFRPFLEDLMTTIRNEIASCGEKAYTVLPISDASTLLFFTEMKDLMEFAQRRPGWTINPTLQTVSFGTADSETTAAAQKGLDKTLIMENALSYAKELESIV